MHTCCKVFYKEELSWSPDVFHPDSLQEKVFKTICCGPVIIGIDEGGNAVITCSWDMPGSDLMYRVSSSCGSHKDMKANCTSRHVQKCSHSSVLCRLCRPIAPAFQHRPLRKICSLAYKVEIQHAGGVAHLEVEEGETILQTALDAGIDLTHDCKMGVCMTCPAKLVEGEVDQSAGMLDETAKEKGYTLLCVSEPRTDCIIQTIEEACDLPVTSTNMTVQDEILEEVLCSSANAG